MKVSQEQHEMVIREVEHRRDLAEEHEETEVVEVVEAEEVGLEGL